MKEALIIFIILLLLLMIISVFGGSVKYNTGGGGGDSHQSLRQQMNAYGFPSFSERFSSSADSLSPKARAPMRSSMPGAVAPSTTEAFYSADGAADDVEPASKKATTVEEEEEKAVEKFTSFKDKLNQLKQVQQTFGSGVEAFQSSEYAPWSAPAQ